MDIRLFEILSEPYSVANADMVWTPTEVEEVKDAYRQMSGFLRDVLASTVEYRFYLDIVNRLTTSLDNYFANRLLPGAVLPSQLPIINRNMSREVIARITSLLQASGDPEQQRVIIIAAFAALCFETQRLWTTDGNLQNATSQQPPINFLAELGSYGFWKSITDTESQSADIFGIRRAIKSYTEEDIVRLRAGLNEHHIRVSKLMELTDQAKLDIDTFLADSKIDVESTAKKVADVANELESHQKTVTNLLSTASTASEHVKAFAKAVREEMKIDTSKKLWKQRARGSMISFWISALVIAGAIFVPPYWLIHHVDDVVFFLRRIGDAAVQGLPPDASAAQLTAATISRLVIVSAPLAMYFWAIKLIVRFNARSMVLMDDARQRHTTMDTYFHLIEKDAASTEERGLMLNALFRPLPGQGQESVEPPNFIELIGKGRE